MLKAFKHHIEARFPELLGNRFLLACSGGRDSMALAHLCRDMGLDFALAHCNFRLRGEESDEDAGFVKGLANKWNVIFFSTEFNTVTYANKNKVSIQVAARELRYRWFAQLQQQHGIPFLVTAHHADDNMETFLINLSRGTGIEGLAGIPEKTESVFRPLLPFSRERIKSYANEQKLEWREDSSNLDLKYLRNKIRHEVVPKLSELHPAFLENFKTTQRHLAQTVLVLKDHIAKIREGLFVPNQGRVEIDIKELSALAPLRTYLFLLFRDYGFSEWNNLQDLLKATSGKEVRSGTHRLVKDRDRLLLAPLAHTTSETWQILESDTEIDRPISLRITQVKNGKQSTKNVLYVAKETLKYPLVLRKWEKGDYFYPLGMKGKKKISKFFKDEKIDILSKERQWLLCSGEDIVWVVGRRADNRFRVTGDTLDIVKFELNK